MNCQIKILLCAIVLWGFSPVFAGELENQLGNHPAPYLALHGDDPVKWQTWGEPVLEMARAQQKIVYLSIGYFACHWCHVMQKESYKNNEIAAYLNTHFIPVKIDRELEPALDRRLMSFTQNILGRGGWPLNVFITPSGHPVYSVLYAPPDQFLETLKRLQTVWSDDRERVQQLVNTEATANFTDAGPEIDRTYYQEIIAASAQGVMANADLESGGFGNRQKFPSVPQLEYLLEHYQQTPDPTLARFLTTTLSAMAEQGMHDHLLGGFFRYTTDALWAIPHFEKMLYDNANLAALYLHSGRILGIQEHQDIATSTLNFMQENMWHPDGALISSFSAVDDHEVEGGSYLWAQGELQGLLDQDELRLVNTVFGLDRPMELPAGNHLRYFVSLEEYAERNALSLEHAQMLLQQGKQKMLVARGRRSLPEDDKLLAGWNGLALSAFAAAASETGDASYARTARQLRDFLVEQLWDGDQLARSMAKGQLLGSASLEDYAYVGRGLLHWGIYSQDESDLQLALEITREGWRRFYRGNAWYQGDSTLLAPASGEEMLSDAANPAPSAILIQNSLILAERFPDEALRNRALSALNRGDTMLTRLPFWHVSQLQALNMALNL